MNHEESQLLVSEFIDRELEDEEEQGLFEHLRTCKECRRFLRFSWSLQADIAATKGERPIPSPSSPNRFKPDRPSVHTAKRKSSFQSALSTMILLTLVILVVGILFSASDRARATSSPAVEQKVKVQQSISPAEKNHE